MVTSLPTFLGIGAPKAGSTWLYELLRAHPNVGMSELRKEIHYFDRNYDRGQAWYAQFFEGADGCDVVGEYTPLYLYCEALSERIAESAPSVRKLLVSLRDPVDRAHSSFGFRVRVEGYNGSFEQFLDERPATISRGRYGYHLERLRPWLERGALLPLIFEEAVQNVERTKIQLADFLGVESTLFPVQAGHKRVNQRYSPRFKRLYVKAITFSRHLRHGDHYRTINFAKRIGVKRLFEQKGTTPVPPMKLKTRQRLVELFEPDVVVLEELLGRPMTYWREAWARGLADKT